MPPPLPAGYPTSRPSVTTSAPSIASNASSKPLDLHDLDAAESIHTTRTWLRALWTDWSVEVRVFSGALGGPLGEACLGRAAVTPPCRALVPTSLLPGVVVPPCRRPRDAVLFPRAGKRSERGDVALVVIRTLVV
jgi:hypothetical protein